MFSFSFSLATMSQQLQSRNLLILGDSNIRRYLYRAGGAYSLICDCGMARNMSEFGNSLRMVDSTNYRIIVFAMMTNIVIDAGSVGNDHTTRMDAIEECISPLRENLIGIFNLKQVRTLDKNCSFLFVLQLYQLQPRHFANFATQSQA